MTKYRGKLSLTTEFLRAVLQIPKEVELYAVEGELERDLLHVYLGSAEEVPGFTVQTGEGMSFCTVSPAVTQEAIVEQYRNYVAEYDKQQLEEPELPKF